MVDGLKRYTSMMKLSLMEIINIPMRLSMNKILSNQMDALEMIKDTYNKKNYVKLKPPKRGSNNNKETIEN